MIALYNPLDDLKHLFNNQWRIATCVQEVQLHAPKWSIWWKRSIDVPLNKSTSYHLLIINIYSTIILYSV